MRLSLPPISCKVPTPDDLAYAMVRVLGDKPNALWLEPSHGNGVFLKALSDFNVGAERITAIDLDPRPQASDSLAGTSRGIDFLSWAKTTNLRFDFIIGNPPYVAIKRLRPSLRRTASRVLDIDGNPIGTRANTWYAFVVSSIRLLKKGGSLAFVLPSAAEFADYTSELRNALKDSFARLEIYRSNKSMFPGVQEGTVVAFARGYEQHPFRYYRREFEDRKHLVAALENASTARGRVCPKNTNPTLQLGTSLASIAKIRLGGVTGDAKYFLMNETRRKSLGLPDKAFIPIVSKAKHLRMPSIDLEEWEKLKQTGERVWLFSPDPDDTLNQAVKEYLELGAESGGCNRKAYKVSTRTPWYRVPLPEKPDAFMSGMAQSGPWMSLNEMTTLNATNTLYVVTFHTEYQADKYKWALAMLTSISQKQIRRSGRRYADGLIKYEPGLLAKVKLPFLRGHDDFREPYTMAVEALLANDLGASRKIADSFLQ